jgi:hypothetical protein
MKKSDIRIKYRTYGYRGNVPFIPFQQQFDKKWKAYFDGKFGNVDEKIDNIDVNVQVDVDTEGIKQTIVETLAEQFEGLNFDEKFEAVHTHINEVKQHLCCDICCAKTDIKKHIDEKFEAVNFERKFSDLNDQVNEILARLN